MASIIYYSAHSFASSVLDVSPVVVEYQQKPEKFPQKTRYVPSKIKSRSEETKANLSRATTTLGIDRSFSPRAEWVLVLPSERWVLCFAKKNEIEMGVCWIALITRRWVARGRENLVHGCNEWHGAERPSGQ
jgi:hypothetical protein